MDTHLSRQGNEVLCGDPHLSNLWPSPPPAACCFSSLLSHQQLPFLFLFHLVRRDIVFSWLLLLETGVPACLRYLEILDKREFFSFQTPFLFCLFLPPDSVGSEVVPSLKAAIYTKHFGEGCGESDLGPCDCLLSLPLVHR